MEHRKIATVTCPRCGHGNAPGAAECEHCDAPLKRRRARTGGSDTMMPGAVIKDTYRVVEFVGEGGAGTVYRGEHVSLGHQVAIKRLSRKLIRDDGMRRRFHEEGQIQANLNHPNIVRVTDLIDDGDLFAIIMEYIEGVSLDGWLAQRRAPPDIEQSVRVFLGLLDGVGYAHDRGIIHRDLKPANVMLTRMGGQLVPKVTDFGIAKIMELARHTETGTTMGTIHYAAPEQLTDAKSVDRCADIYSLGCTFYEMVTGELPFDSDNIYAIMKAHIEAPRPNACDTNADVPAPLSSVILRAMSRAPERRFQSCAEFADAIRSAMAESRSATTPEMRVTLSPRTEDTEPAPTSIRGGHDVTTDADLALRAPVTSHRLSHAPHPSQPSRTTTGGAGAQSENTPTPPSRRGMEPAQIVVTVAIAVLSLAIIAGTWTALRNDADPAEARELSGAQQGANGSTPGPVVTQPITGATDADLVALADPDASAEADAAPPEPEEVPMSDAERLRFCRVVPERYVAFELVGNATVDQALTELAQWQDLNCRAVGLGAEASPVFETQRASLRDTQVAMSIYRIHAIRTAAQHGNPCADAGVVARNAITMLQALNAARANPDILPYQIDELNTDFRDYAIARHEEMEAEYGGEQCAIPPMPEELRPQYGPQMRRIVAQPPEPEPDPVPSGAPSPEATPGEESPSPPTF